MPSFQVAVTCWSWHPTDSGCRYRAAVGDFALNDIIPRGASPPLNCKHSQRCGISVPQQLVDTSPGWSTARVRAHSKRRLQQTAADRSRPEQAAGCIVGASEAWSSSELASLRRSLRSQGLRFRHTVHPRHPSIFKAVPACFALPGPQCISNCARREAIAPLCAASQWMRTEYSSDTDVERGLAKCCIAKAAPQCLGHREPTSLKQLGDKTKSFQGVCSPSEEFAWLL